MTQHRFLFLPLVFSLVTACSGLKNTTPKIEIVAKVNNRTISTEQLSERINRPSNLLTNEGEDLPLEKKKEALGHLVEEEIVLQAAMKEGLLESSQRLRSEVVREYLMVKLGGGKEQPTQDEVKAFFEKNRNELEQIRARHILCKDEKTAAALLKQLRSQGAKANFEALAGKASEDETTKAKGGDLGWFPRDKMVPTFSNAAFALAKVGDISDVVKTEFGYHIIQLTGDRRGFDNYKGSIRMNMAKENRKRMQEELLKDLEKTAKIKVYDDVVAKVTLNK